MIYSIDEQAKKDIKYKILKRVNQTTTAKDQEKDENEEEDITRNQYTTVIKAPSLLLQKSKSNNDTWEDVKVSDRKEDSSKNYAEQLPQYNFQTKLKRSSDVSHVSPSSLTLEKSDERGLFDKVFDMTGVALEKFGNFFKSDSKDDESQERSRDMAITEQARIEFKQPITQTNKFEGTSSSSFLDQFANLGFRSLGTVSPASQNKAIPRATETGEGLAKSEKRKLEIEEVRSQKSAIENPAENFSQLVSARSKTNSRGSPVPNSIAQV